jgi:hypothetical protein
MINDKQSKFKESLKSVKLNNEEQKEEDEKEVCKFHPHNYGNIYLTQFIFYVKHVMN